MYLKSCYCGDSQKNFKRDIGPNYLAECCEAKGYDCYGKQKNAKPEPKMEKLAEEVASGDKSMADAMKESASEDKSSKKSRRSSRRKKANKE